MEEIVVTAQKREQNVQDVGIAISALTGDQMRQLGYSNAQQVRAMAPGVSTVQPNGEANYSIAIHGIANSDFTTNEESRWRSTWTRSTSTRCPVRVSYCSTWSVWKSCEAYRGRCMAATQQADLPTS
ncbi:MAG: Plug domain-containing protein [Gammaproteobacteria bacterium]|nr:Plug domain-containing protein [Gammaproteobacteria bacterium]